MVQLGMTVLPLLVSGALVAACVRLSRRAGTLAAAFAGLLLAAQWWLADAGVFRAWDRTPPPAVLLAVGMGALVTTIACSTLGRRLIDRTPLWALIGVQGFRLPLELVMHQAAVEGTMPVQMSYSGWNFDILTGVSALIVAGLTLAGRASSRLVLLWNAAGSMLLVTIVGIAVASTPTFAAFGPDQLNTWIADPPYVWLPGILVPAALLGHLLLWRRGTDPLIR